MPLLTQLDQSCHLYSTHYIQTSTYIIYIYQPDLAVTPAPSAAAAPSTTVPSTTFEWVEKLNLCLCVRMFLTLCLIGWRLIGLLEQTSKQRPRRDMFFFWWNFRWACQLTPKKWSINPHNLTCKKNEFCHSRASRWTEKKTTSRLGKSEKTRWSIRLLNKLIFH